jgi:hypothetical protein
MAFKYINAAISGEYQKILSRLIEDPETVNLYDTPTSNLPNDVPKTGLNVDGILTGSLQSIEFDGVDDFLKLPTTEGLGTEILLEDIGTATVKHGATANNLALEAWIRLDSTATGIDTNSEFFEVTIQRNSVSSTTGYDGVYMARTIYATTASTSAHFIDFQFASGSTFAYSLTSNKSISLNEWHHVWCEYTVTGANQNPRFTPTPKGWMRIYIDGVLDRQQTLDDLNDPGVANSTLPFPATADAVTYGFDRAISFDGRVDEMRLWLNSGTTNSIAALANKGNIGVPTNAFNSQTNAAQVKLDFAPSAEYLAAWWRFEGISAVDLFASVADSVPDATSYGHSATPQNFTGSIDFSEEQTIVSGLVVTGLENSIAGQSDLFDLRGGTYDHGGMTVIHDGQNELTMEQGVENLVTCASNAWTASGGAAVNHDILNIFYGSSAYNINTGGAGEGAVHTIDYSHLLFDKNTYTMSLRLLLATGSPSAQVTFTLGDKANRVATTAIMDRNVWQPVVIRNTATETHAGASITGEVSILGVTNSSSDDNGALFRVDGLQISEGTFPATFVGPEQVRKAGEISWVIGD